MACLLLINLVALSVSCADTFHKAFVVPKLSELKLVVISVCNLQKLWELCAHVAKLIRTEAAFCNSDFCCVLHRRSAQETISSQ